MMNNFNPAVIVITGPTAVGKSAVAQALALRLGGEIVAADSRQVYRYLDIGTAKPSSADRRQVPHHLLDLVDPDQEFSLGLYQRKAREVLRDVISRKRLPLLTGGTGLYIRALTEGFRLPAIAPDPQLRSRLEAEAAAGGVEVLFARLEKIDREAAARMDPANLRRIIRALEVYEKTGLPLSRHWAESPPRPLPWPVLKLALERNKPDLDRRIAMRSGQMLAAGLLEEVRGLMEKGYAPALRRNNVLGYPEFIGHLEGAWSLEEAVEKLNRNSCRYARRQLTWLRREPHLEWIGLEAADPVEGVVDDLERIIRDFLDRGPAASIKAP